MQATTSFTVPSATPPSTIWRPADWPHESPTMRPSRSLTVHAVARTATRIQQNAFLGARQLAVSKAPGCSVRVASTSYSQLPVSARSFSTTLPRSQEIQKEDIERVVDACDVCIVGGGPAGLSAAIRLKQQANEASKELRVVLLEKGPEVGSHILSGAVIEPRALNELMPDWKDRGAPLHQEATHDSMRWLTESKDYPMPHPPQMANKGNYIISLSRFTSWLAEQAEELGVEIYPGFAGAQFNIKDGQIAGVTTPDIGLDKQGQPKDSFEPGMTFQARLTLLAEGAHGSLSKKAINMFNLRENVEEQTYGLGVKEVWRVKPEKHVPGRVVHTLGWPLAPECLSNSSLASLSAD